MSESEAPVPKRSSREPEAIRRALEAWLAGRLARARDVVIPEVSSPSASGMSSETLLFDATWREGSDERTGAFVARLEPASSDEPIFPSYDFESQFRLLQLVAQHSAVPVPRARWLEPDPAAIGARFFVMERAVGRVPPDVMPYNMGSWLSEASPAEQRHLQDATVEAIAGLHAIDPVKAGAEFLGFDLPGATPLARHLENQRRYYDWARADRRHPVLERAFAWLEANFPKEEGPAVISWGDSRIGNVMYDGFEPIAVLDWEMAALAPREIDLGWLVFMHRFFEEIAGHLGLPGLPDFLRSEDVRRHYAQVSGHAPADLRFYETYAALRHGIIMTRVRARQVHFGEDTWPDDVDEAIPHRAQLEQMLDGTYWN